MDTHEVAWAAGLWEGEGSVIHRSDYADYRTTPGRAVWVQAAMVSTDLDRLEAFRDVVGFGTIASTGPPKKPHHKPRWVWRISSHERVQALGCMLWLWLGPRRRGQFAAALMAWNAHKPKRFPTVPRRGRSLEERRELRRATEERARRRKGVQPRRSPVHAS